LRAAVSEPVIMLVHALAPPTPGGTPVVLRRLLSGLPAIRLEVVTRSALRPVVRRGGAEVLSARYRFVPKWPGWGRRWLAGRVVAAAVDLSLALVAGARVARWARREKAHWIMSVVDEGFSPVAGAVAARLAGLPHVIMVFDLWQENAYPEVDRWVAGLFEGTLWRGAAAVVGYDEEIARHYDRKHGVRARVIATPIDADAPGAVRAAPRRDGSTAEVLFAGALYWAQEEAARRLSRVCAALPDIRLTVVGDATTARAAGIAADSFEPQLDSVGFRSRVARADVAVLCLSFGSAHPEVVATASPARLPEYMASGTPLLVHAPAGSHVAEYARSEDFAEVVDRADEAALEAGLRRVLADRELSGERARRARDLALTRHAATRVCADLRAILAEIDGRRSLEALA
jgi:glycosyltransferase involved in cell wall biosynthesis